jgi:hypothetical protein
MADVIDPATEISYDAARRRAERQRAIAGCDRLLAALRRRHSYGCGELKICGSKFIRRVA